MPRASVDIFPPDSRRVIRRKYGTIRPYARPRNRMSRDPQSRDSFLFGGVLIIDGIAANDIGDAADDGVIVASDVTNTSGCDDHVTEWPSRDQWDDDWADNNENCNENNNNNNGNGNDNDNDVRGKGVTTCGCTYVR